MEDGEIIYAGGSGGMAWMLGGFVEVSLSGNSHENRTLPAHTLYDGTVVRTATDNGSGVTIKTKGEGENLVPLLARLNEYWGRKFFKQLDHDISASIGK